MGVFHEVRRECGLPRSGGLMMHIFTDLSTPFCKFFVKIPTGRICPVSPHLRGGSRDKAGVG